MKSVEYKVKNHLIHSEQVKYPDFEKMFNSIQTGELRVVNDVHNRPQRQKTKAAIVLGISLAVMATPVYAALQYDWSDVLSNKSGIESALKAGYGQLIEQSVTAHGVTLTVHNAFVDDNRTVLLYTIKPELETEKQEIRYNQMLLKDSNGQPIEGHYYQKWNAEQGVYQGYFETDWVMQEKQSDLQFSISDVLYLEDLEQEIRLDPKDSSTQQFNIQKNGIDKIEVQSFKYAKGEIMINSEVTFSDSEVKEQSWAGIRAYDTQQEVIKETENPEYGMKGVSGDYFSRQMYNEQQFKEGDRFTFTYTHEKQRTEGTWNLNLLLSRQEMDTGTFKKELNIPIHSLADEASISGMVVTPTQIRLTIDHDEEYFRLPYRTYQLQVDGKVMDGLISFDGKMNANQTELRFEQSNFLMDVKSLVDKPMTLIAKKRVDEHAGSRASIHLTDISTEPKTIASDYEGFPIIWTYYIKDGNLYVESESPDNTFGGVNQTYFLEGEEKHYLVPHFFSELGNKHMDVYKDFKKSDLELYVWNYTTRSQEKELRVSLTGKSL